MSRYFFTFMLLFSFLITSCGSEELKKNEKSMDNQKEATQNKTAEKDIKGNEPINESQVYAQIIEKNKFKIIVSPYQLNSSEFPQKEILQIKKAASLINKIIEEMQASRVKKMITVKINGHADKTGQETLNSNLSKVRAFKLKIELEKYIQKIDQVDFIIAGLGAAQLADPKRPESGANRRVEIILDNKN